MSYVRCFHAFSPARSPDRITTVRLLSIDYSVVSSSKLPFLRQLYLPLVKHTLMLSCLSSCSRCSASYFLSTATHDYLYFFNLSSVTSSTMLIDSYLPPPLPHCTLYPSITRLYLYFGRSFSPHQCAWYEHHVFIIQTLHNSLHSTLFSCNVRSPAMRNRATKYAVRYLSPLSRNHQGRRGHHG